MEEKPCTFGTSLLVIVLGMFSVTVLALFSMQFASPVNSNELSLINHPKAHPERNYVDRPTRNMSMSATNYHLAYINDDGLGWALRKQHMLKQKYKFNQVSKIVGGRTQFFQEHWEPTLSCPYPARVGQIGDGGKWVCNPLEILKKKQQDATQFGTSGKVLVYSLGSNNDFSFEKEIHEMYEGNVEIHTFDQGAPSNEPHFLQYHTNKIVAVGAEQGTDQSLKALREQIGHSDQNIDILKMDIEGGEYEVLKTLVDPQVGCLLGANMLLMETHHGTAAQYHEIFKGLNEVCHMELYMKEPNIWTNGVMVEWCFVRVDWEYAPTAGGMLHDYLGYVIDDAEGWRARTAYRHNMHAKFANAKLSIRQRFTNANDKSFFQTYFEPTFSCPYPERIGDNGNGGLWVCNLKQLHEFKMQQQLAGQQPSLLVFEFDSSRNNSFYKELLSRFGSMLDMNNVGRQEASARDEGMTYHDVNIVSTKEENQTTNSLSLASFKRMIKPNQAVDIMRFDIPGKEVEVLNEMASPETGCLLNTNMLLLKTYNAVGRTYGRMLANLLNTCKMEIFMKEPVIYTNDGTQINWGFVRIDWDKVAPTSHPPTTDPANSKFLAPSDPP
eukprot:Platyproteum_vivax@DN7569_c0_g1_i10.p1